MQIVQVILNPERLWLNQHYTIRRIFFTSKWEENLTLLWYHEKSYINSTTGSY
jgi:hypothetical protein